MSLPAALAILILFISIIAGLVAWALRPSQRVYDAADEGSDADPYLADQVRRALHPEVYEATMSGRDIREAVARDAGGGR